MNTVAARRAVIVMAKRPVAGNTKTRLTPALSPQQAADMYERLLLDTLANVQARDDCTTIIAIDAAESADYFTTIASSAPQLEQIGDALGDRLNTVLTAGLSEGYAAVFALSSDSPDLPASHLDDAFAALDRDDVDVVVGPTEDGGYYLIGWKQPWATMVTDVKMSTPDVLADTLAIASGLGAKVHLAPRWYDIDDPVDLDRLRTASTATRAPQSLAYLTENTN